MDRQTAIRVQLALRGEGLPDVAKRAGVSRRTAWLWATDRRGVKPETQQRLIEALWEPNGVRDVPAQEKQSA